MVIKIRKNHDKCRFQMKYFHLRMNRGPDHQSGPIQDSGGKTSTKYFVFTIGNKYVINIRVATYRYIAGRVWICVVCRSVLKVQKVLSKYLIGTKYRQEKSFSYIYIILMPSFFCSLMRCAESLFRGAFIACINFLHPATFSS